MTTKYDKLARFGCIVCRVHLGRANVPAEIHHIREGAGISRKNEDVIPLCHLHHRNGGYGVAFHAGAKKWRDNFGTEHELLDKLNQLLKTERGL